MIVLGNGESRKKIDINQIDAPKVGCNAIYRDFFTDYLVCVDKRMMQEALDAKVNHNSTYLYTRQDWFRSFKTKKVRQLPDLPYVGSDRWDEPFQWGSGPYAVLLGAKFSNLKNVKLIGFDLYSKTDCVNNIYKGTNNYDDETKRPVDPRYWIHQIGMVFKCFPEISFEIFQDNEWVLPKAWKLPNVKVDSISSLYYNV